MPMQLREIDNQSLQVHDKKLCVLIMNLLPLQRNLIEAWQVISDFDQSTCDLSSVDFAKWIEVPSEAHT